MKKTKIEVVDKKTKINFFKFDFNNFLEHMYDKSD